MAYASSVAELRKILDLGFAQLPSSGGVSPQIRGNSIYSYQSSHAAEDFEESSGFFTGVGGQVHTSTGTPTYEAMTRSTQNVGLVPGDLIVATESSAGVSVGRVTWHACIASTYGTDGYDCTLSKHQST